MKSFREFMMRALVEKRLEIRFGIMTEEGDSSAITSCRKYYFSK
jgi:hypothetical protein